MPNFKDYEIYWIQHLEISSCQMYMTQSNRGIGINNNTNNMQKHKQQLVMITSTITWVTCITQAGQHDINIYKSNATT